MLIRRALVDNSWISFEKISKFNVLIIVQKIDAQAKTVQKPASIKVSSWLTAIYSWL